MFFVGNIDCCFKTDCNSKQDIFFIHYHFEKAMLFYVYYKAPNNVLSI